MKGVDLQASILAKKIATLALTKKASDLVILDLRKLTSVADFFVICSADSEVQVLAIADAVETGLSAKGASPWHREAGSPHWVLLDYVDVVLHIFHKHTRSFYNLEKLWGDAKVVHVSDTPRPRARGHTPAKKRKPSKKVAL